MSFQQSLVGVLSMEDRGAQLLHSRKGLQTTQLHVTPGLYQFIHRALAWV